LRLTLSEHFIGLDQLSAQLAGGQTTGAPLKKKSIAGQQPSSDQEAVNKSISIDADINTINTSWQGISEQCGRQDASLGAFLLQARPVALDKSTLILQFDNNGQGQLAKNMCERKSAIINSTLSQILSTNITIRLGLDKEQKRMAPSKETSAPTAEAAPPINRQQRQEALNDPAVQMVLKGLDATPVEIKKVEIEFEGVAEENENSD
jgi:hypothetical protein